MWTISPGVAAGLPPAWVAASVPNAITRRGPSIGVISSLSNLGDSPVHTLSAGMRTGSYANVLLTAATALFYAVSCDAVRKHPPSNSSKE
ncbi:MAG TPA: hypothetical protein VH640_18515 [Bryobacteraceae bacterium]|jgi:hypothetical protein